MCRPTGIRSDDFLSKRNIKEAISLYIEILREDGKPIPEPTTRARPVSVPA